MRLKKAFRRTSVQWIGLLPALLLIAMPLMVLNTAHPYALQNLHFIIAQHPWICTGLRIGTLIFFFGVWPAMIHALGRYQQWSKGRLTLWLQQRATVFLWLLLFEGVFCENLPLMLLQLWKG